jgi:hypothetical protein
LTFLNKKTLNIDLKSFLYNKNQDNPYLTAIALL